MYVRGTVSARAATVNLKGGNTHAPIDSQFIVDSFNIASGSFNILSEPLPGVVLGHARFNW